VLADDRGAAGSQAGDGGLDVVGGEGEMADTGVFAGASRDEDSVACARSSTTMPPWSMRSIGPRPGASLRGSTHLRLWRPPMWG
jgi:hypothetical protein